MMKTGNEYQDQYPSFDDTPKAVIAAIAFSLAMRLSEDNPSEAIRLCSAEWQALHNAGIVPQKPQRAG